MYVVGTGVWFSRDGGDTWQKDPAALALGPATAIFVCEAARSLAVHPTDPHIVFVTQPDFTVFMGTFFEFPVGSPAAGPSSRTRRLFRTARPTAAPTSSSRTSRRTGSFS